ncbi:Ribosomal protein S18 acetylase RimI [Micromonospora pattaloongensis]|uniref:Ribosomal protein S18 acetylase RimI n=1 Tax=Micromonospora pattaloongensis TaxID=405436 RepID=A0A1H3JZG5_9ACTN|nr:GNAT family N-acetyltransferase [Micromonospora pattaloongensis]SDY45317.1 Ribosomal protein S18 acetylase RimI [Micromonospora pattaloongensis]
MALWRIRATVDDRPGYLAVLAASLALRSVNILAVQVHTTEAGAVDDFLVDAPDAMTGQDLVAAVERGRGRDPWVARAEARGLADQPTRTLGLANRLVRDPESLGDVLGGLLGATSVTWRPSGEGQPGFRRYEMWLPDPAGGAFEIVRTAPDFTPAEFARAQAIVELAATVGRRAADQVTLVLTDGSELTLRPATGDDLPAVLALHERCSAGTLHSRYLGGSSAPSRSLLERLLEPAQGVTLLAVLGDERGPVVAMANLVAEGEIGEVALLVEDAWQRRGIGTALLRRLVAHAGWAPYAALIAHTRADNTGMLRTLRRLGRPGPVDRDGDLVSVTVPLTSPPAAVPAPVPPPSVSPRTPTAPASSA